MNALDQESRASYVLTGRYCWITVNNLSVYVTKTDEGVVVDIYTLNKEMAPPIASTWATFAEGKEAAE